VRRAKNSGKTWRAELLITASPAGLPPPLTSYAYNSINAPWPFTCHYACQTYAPSGNAPKPASPWDLCKHRWALTWACTHLTLCIPHYTHARRFASFLYDKRTV